MYRTLPHHSLRQRGAAPGASSHEPRSDVCARLFALCLSCQRELLDARGITCLFDVGGGTLANWKLNIVAEIITDLMAEICHAAVVGTRGGRITVSLHQRRNLWILAVVDEGIRASVGGPSPTRRKSLDVLARRLPGIYRIQPTARGGITAVMFGAIFGAAERGSVATPEWAIENALNRHRRLLGPQLPVPQIGLLAARAIHWIEPGDE
jgi:hypothetical protein